MTITEFLEYILDNSDGPVTFSVAGAKVSVNLEAPKEFVSLRSFVNLKPPPIRKSPNMIEVTERVCRSANKLGPEWVAGHTLAPAGKSATTWLKSRKIPYTLFYGTKGKGTKMSFVAKKDLK